MATWKLVSTSDARVTAAAVAAVDAVDVVVVIVGRDFRVVGFSLAVAFLCALFTDCLRCILHSSACV